MNDLPRHIDPSEITVGDRIRIELPKNQGVIHTLEGIVHNIEVSGGITYYYTQEGANILAFYPQSMDIKGILLIERKEKPAKLFSDKFWQTNNDDVFAETKERLA